MHSQSCARRRFPTPYVPRTILYCCRSYKYNKGVWQLSLMSTCVQVRYRGNTIRLLMVRVASTHHLENANSGHQLPPLMPRALGIDTPFAKTQQHQRHQQGARGEHRNKRSSFTVRSFGKMYNSSSLMSGYAGRAPSKAKDSRKSAPCSYTGAGRSGCCDYQGTRYTSCLP